MRKHRFGSRIVARLIALITAAVLFVMSVFFCAMAETSTCYLYNSALAIEVPDGVTVEPTIMDPDDIYLSDSFFNIADVYDENGDYSDYSNIILYARRDDDSDSRTFADPESEEDLREAFDSFGKKEIRDFLDIGESVSDVRIVDVIQGSSTFAKVSANIGGSKHFLYWTYAYGASLIVERSNGAEQGSRESELMDSFVSGIYATSLLYQIDEGELDNDEYVDLDDGFDFSSVIALLGVGISIAVALVKKGGAKSGKKSNGKKSKSASTRKKSGSWAGKKAALVSKKSASAEELGDSCKEILDIVKSSVKESKKSKKSLKMTQGIRLNGKPVRIESNGYVSIAGDYEANLRVLVKSGLLTREQMNEMLEKHYGGR